MVKTFLPVIWIGFLFLNSFGPFCVLANNQYMNLIMGNSIISIVKTFLPLESALDKLSRDGKEAVSLAKTMGILINKTIKENPGIVSDNCARDLIYYTESVVKHRDQNEKNTAWQYQFADSYGKLESGFTEGHMSWSGDIKQCIRLNIRKDCKKDEDCQSKEGDFKGKYCLVKLNLDMLVFMVPFKMGACIPSTCKAQEANNLLSKTVNVAGQYAFQFDEETCQINDPKTWDTTSKAILLLFGALFALLIIGTIYEISLSRHDSNSHKYNEFSTNSASKIRTILSAFSLRRNTAKLFNTTSRKEGTLECIHGLRALSMMWVVAGHYSVQFFWIEPWKNPTESLQLLQLFFTQFITNAEFAVDTFICLTGFLIVYTTLTYVKKFNGRFHIGVFYLHRILRLTPAYTITLAFMCGLFIHTGSGPFWPNTEHYNAQECRKTWWRNLLYINVYFSEKEYCLAQSWYLCLDTFFYVTSPILLYPMIWSSKSAIVMWILCFFGSILTPAWLIYDHDLASFNTWQMRPEQREDYIEEVYDKPWCRIHAFLIGMLFGYFYLCKGKNLIMNKIFVAITWICVSVMMLSIILGTYRYSSGKANMSREMFVIYGTLTRPAWAVGVGWIIVSCAAGYGGVVNTILSHKFFIPLSRLSYSYYLVHMSVIINYMASRKENLTQDIHSTLYIIVTVFTISTGLAWLLNVLTEGPMTELEKSLMHPSRKVSTKTVNPLETNTTSYLKVPEEEEETQDNLSINIESIDDSETDVYWDLNDKFETTSEEDEKIFERPRA